MRLFFQIGTFVFCSAVLSTTGFAQNGGTQFLVRLKTATNQSCVVFNDGASMRTTLVNCQGLPTSAAWQKAMNSSTQYQAYYREQGMPNFEAVPASDLKTVPLLIPMALEASQIQGYGARSLLRFDQATAQDPISSQELTLANFKELVALVNGQSANYMKASKGGAVLPAISGSPSSMTAGQIWYNSDAKAIQFFDGANVQPMGTPVCGIRSITAGAGLTGGTITTVGTIALENFGTPGTYYKVTTDIKGRVKSGATSLVEADIPNLVTPGKVSGSAINTGVIGGNTQVNTTGSLTTTGAVTAGSVTANTVTATTVAASAVATTKFSTGNYVLTLPATLPSAVNQVLTADSTGRLSWIDLPQGGSGTEFALHGTLPMVVTGTGVNTVVSVNGATTSTSGVVTLAPTGGTTAGTVVQANDSRLSDGRAPSGAAGGDLSGTYPNPQVAKLQGTAVSATTPGDGQILRFNLSARNWASGSVGLMDLRSQAGLTQIPATCTASQTVIYTSVTDQLVCADIAIAYTAVSGLGNSATKDVGTAAGTVAAGDDARFGNALKIQSRDVAAAAPAEAQVLTWNAGANQWQPKALPAQTQGTVTSITAGNGLTGGTITTSGTIAVNAGTGANQIVQLDGSAKLPAVDGSQVTNVNAARLQGIPVNATSPANNQVLQFNGSQWAGATLTDSSLTWGAQAANTFFAGPNGSGGAPSFRAIVAADLPAGAYDSSYFKNGGNSFGGDALLGTNDSGALGLKTAGAIRVAVTNTGAVGVGTVSPQAALDVNGAVKIGNDANCTSGKAGSLRWNGTAFDQCNGGSWTALVPTAPTPVPTTPAAYGYQINSTDAVLAGNIPWSDAVPTSAQGSEVLTATITPSSANSLIEVSVLMHYSQPFNKGRFFTVAAFANGAASAFASSNTGMMGNNCGGASDTQYMCQVTLSSVMPAGSTGPVTIHVRAGSDTGTWEINGAGGRKMGGSLQSTLILREVKMQ